MASPFPGMNPYLENASVFHDFHQRWAIAAADLLTPQLRPHFFTRIDVDIFVTELTEENRLLLGRPDAMVISVGDEPGSVGEASSLNAPAIATMPVEVDEEESNSIEIVDRDSQRVICVIELLSPANKNHVRHREEYLSKVRRIRHSDVHLVEIDLLRGGPRMPWSGLPDCDYYAMVSRAQDRPQIGVWPVRLRERLPQIPVPLTNGYSPAKLDLQAVLDRVYESAGYADQIYKLFPQPPLHPADAQWAAEILATARV